MKTLHKLKALSLALLFTSSSFAQVSLEDYEDETEGDTTFINDGQSFSISSPGSAYDIYEITPDGGWNGTAADDYFIDNSGSASGSDGSEFSYYTTDGANINIKSLYLFCSTGNLTNHDGEVTFTAFLDKAQQFTFTVSSGFSDPETFSPNNGFTLIDFSSTSAGDVSSTDVDSLVVVSTGTLDYMALDAFSWEPANITSLPKLSVKGISLYPNPTSGMVYGKYPENQEYTISDMTGQTVQSGTAENGAISFENLENGIYFLQLQSDTESETVKIYKN